MNALAQNLTPARSANWLPGLEVIQAEKTRRLLARSPEALASRAGLVLDPWQRQVLEGRPDALLINCSRQAGKSTTTALLIVLTMLQSDQMILIIAPSLRQSKELMRKVLAFWRKIGRPVQHVHVTRTSLELENGSRLEALPGSSETIRGFSGVTLLVIDEAAQVPDELYSAVSPMLAVAAGRLVALSTPAGKRGWWYELWKEQGIARIKVPATECLRIPREFLARERRRLGEWWFNQEYLCEFQEAKGAAFREKDIDAMFRPDLQRADWLFAEEEVA